MNSPCAASGCVHEAELVVKQLPLCHAHYVQLRLHLDLQGISLHDFEGDLRTLLVPQDPQ